MDALTVCGEFVGRKISGVCSPEIWAILLVTMHEVQQREVPAQPVYQAVHLLPPKPVSTRTLQEKPVPCLTSSYGAGGAFPLAGSGSHDEHRPTGEKEIVLQVFGAQLILHPFTLLEDTLEALQVWGRGHTEEMPGPQVVCLLL